MAAKSEPPPCKCVLLHSLVTRSCRLRHLGGQLAFVIFFSALRAAAWQSIFFPGAYGACIVCVGDHKKIRTPRWYMGNLHYIPRLRRLHSLRGKFNNICAKFLGRLRRLHAYGAIKKFSALRAATWAISVGVQTHKPT